MQYLNPTCLERTGPASSLSRCVAFMPVGAAVFSCRGEVSDRVNLPLDIEAARQGQGRPVSRVTT